MYTRPRGLVATTGVARNFIRGEGGAIGGILYTFFYLFLNVTEEKVCSNSDVDPDLHYGRPPGSVYRR